LEPEDFESQGRVEALARAGHLDTSSFVERFRHLGERVSAVSSKIG